MVLLAGFGLALGGVQQPVVEVPILASSHADLAAAIRQVRLLKDPAERFELLVQLVGSHLRR